VQLRRRVYAAQPVSRSAWQAREGSFVRGAREYTLDEVRELGIEACYEDPVGVLYLWTASYCLRIDRHGGTMVRLTNSRRLPLGPWRSCPTVATVSASPRVEQAREQPGS
jgi:hypothetical protein